MPREIKPAETLADIRLEIDYTRARLEDEPETEALASRTDEWLEKVDEAEVLAKAVAREQARVYAAQTGANRSLDAAVTDFADDLLRAVNKDRTSARWLGIFRKSPSEFNRQDFAIQTSAVRGWLTDPQDEVLVAHNGPLAAAALRSESALKREAALPARRGGLWQKREALAAYLTEQRDALHDDLSAIGRAKKLDRSWANTFFRVLPRAQRPTGGGTGGAGGDVGTDGAGGDTPV